MWRQISIPEKDKRDIEERKKAEMSALQRQINPHFIFNALNTIASFIRFDPQKARDLIISLSTYLRHNLEFNDNLIDIEKELVLIEKNVESRKEATPKNKIDWINEIGIIEIE